ARLEGAVLAQVDHPIDEAADLLGLRLGRLDALVAQDGQRQVLQHRAAWADLASELALLDLMGHLGLLARRELFLAVLRGTAVVADGLVADRRLDETAGREALLDLVERLLAEIAHRSEERRVGEVCR